ncbi:MAG: hypothetical protein GW890_08320 [Vibrio sp.]|nr:hypothetical protein [Vibrio sp.]
MSDFSTKNTKPTAAEYLAATEAELLDRLNPILPVWTVSSHLFNQSLLYAQQKVKEKQTKIWLSKHDIWFLQPGQFALLLLLRFSLV